LGIAALEDKIVQQAVVTILNQIYEVGGVVAPQGLLPEADHSGGSPCEEAIDL
jgi:hypothetical protein